MEKVRMSLISFIGRKGNRHDRRVIDRTPERFTHNAPRLRQIW